MLERLKRIVAVTGHYGSGKTNLAVNLALDFRSLGRRVALADLDIVNPYFRSADFAELLEKKEIELVAPPFARSNVDIPALTARIDALLDTDMQLILDVGGDDAGAAALGRYSAAIRAAGGCDLLYVVNGFRYLTRTAKEASDILEEIQAASRLSVTGVVNNSNLADETDAELVAGTDTFAREIAARYGVPMLFTAVRQELAGRAGELLAGKAVYPVKIYVKKPWEEAL